MKAADGYFVMGATNQKLWLKLCAVLNRPDLEQDPRFATNSNRLDHRELLVAELEKTFATRPSDDWVEVLLADGIPAGKMNSYPEAFESEHGRHRQMRIEIDHPNEGKVSNIGFAVKMNGTPQQVRRPPPLLGQHTGDILAKIGLSQQRIDALTQQGAFE